MGGAAVQAVRQFGGTFGVALTIAFIGAAGADIDVYDRIWWLIAICGLVTSALVLPMHTSLAHRRDGDAAAAAPVTSSARRSGGAPA